MKATKEENIVLRMNKGEASKLLEALEVVRETLEDAIYTNRPVIEQVTQFINVLRKVNP